MGRKGSAVDGLGGSADANAGADTACLVGVKTQGIQPDESTDRQNHRQNQLRSLRKRTTAFQWSWHAQIVQGERTVGRGNGRVRDHGCSFDDGKTRSLTLITIAQQIGKKRRALPDDDALTIAQGIPSVGARCTYR